MSIQEKCLRCGEEDELTARKAVIHIMLAGSEVGIVEMETRLCEHCQSLRRIRVADLPENHYQAVLEPSKLGLTLKGSGDDAAISMLPLVRQLVGFC
jgi:hypothetical protein